jgi:two-component system osmolarity sensor histidine kinase EnvZ
MGRQPHPPALATLYGRWFGALAAVLGMLFAGAVLALVLLPLASRSADDLAGLMVLSAQTWSELPPHTRPDFEAELLARHRIALSPGGPPRAGSLRSVHGFYLGFLEAALARRGAGARLLDDGGPQDGHWIWTTVEAGGSPLGVGFAADRLDTHPLWALLVVTLVGAGAVAVASVWLAKRLVQPIRRLERAAAQVAAGTDPEPLPESGPWELAELARHFNHMARQVRELVDARTTLLAGASHDLRTPLARMRLGLEMLRLDPRPGRIERLERDIDEMNGLIGQLLLLARGMAPQERKRLVLAAWLHEIGRAHV